MKRNSMLTFALTPRTLRQGLRVEINRDLDVCGLGRIAKGTTGTVVRTMPDATAYAPIAHVHLDDWASEALVFRNEDVEDGEITERVFDVAPVSSTHEASRRDWHDARGIETDASTIAVNCTPVLTL